MDQLASAYIGRFAPTPSGPLHFGSIIAALASFLDARSNQGRWLLRIDDLDTPRVKSGALDNILSTLELLCLEWDGTISYQSHRLDFYLEALTRLQQTGMLYRCYCPRKLTRNMPYPGTCRDAPHRPHTSHSLRLKTLDKTIHFKDRVAGPYQQNIYYDSGDFIVLRSDNIIAYNLASALDDDGQMISHVIRGFDLIDSTLKQIYIQSILGIKTPVYGHLPLVTDCNGKKISKRDGATDIKLQMQPATILVEALKLLGQPVDHSLHKADCMTVINWAIEHWDISGIPNPEQAIAIKLG
jgi:glutamyl-Q tRNA(Asp) synthetase